MLEPILALLALILALAARPWRLLANRAPLGHESCGTPAALWTPLLATLVLLPGAWALPTALQRNLSPALPTLPALQWSGACLVLLMLGWPLAVPALLAAGAIAALIAPGLTWSHALSISVWQGLVPATLAMLAGAAMRHLCNTRTPHGARLFVYVLGRGFLCTALCVFAAGVLAQWMDGVAGQPLIARWLMAWGDAVITGMLCAVFVAFRPQWLATWSDKLYLH